MGTSMLSKRSTAERSVARGRRQMGGIIAAFGMLAMIGCGAEGDRPGVAFMPDMLESVPYDTFEANPVSETGGMLLPPEGTIPVTGVPFPYGDSEEEAIRAGLELTNPLAPTAENLARGQHRFESACLVCHGAGGEGDGPIIGRFPNPPNLIAEHAKSYPDGRIYHVITHGQGIMPSHALQVLPEERWAVILYLRQLQGLLDTRDVDAPADEPETFPADVDATPGVAGYPR